MAATGTAVPRPVRYVELFEDPAANPFGQDASLRMGAYRGIYERYRSAPGALSAELLMESTLNLFEAQPVGGIGIFVSDPASTPRLRIIHGIRKYPGSLLCASQNANKAFGYLDDVVLGQGELAQITPSMFDLTSDVRVCTVGHHTATLEADPALSFIAPRPEGAPETEVLRCRQTFFIPFELMPLVLGKRLTPREAFLIIHPWLTSQGLEAIAKPLTDTLRVAGTHVRTAINTVVCLIAHTEPGPMFRTEPDLTVYMQQKVLHRDLLGLIEIPSRAGPETQALTAAVATLTDQQLKANEANERRRAEEAKPATLEDTFGELNACRLRRLCHVGAEDSLPPLYLAWTRKKKTERIHALVQSHVDQAAQELGFPPPFMTTAALKTFQAFRFYGVDECDLGDGLLPMAFAPPGGSPTARKGQMEEARAALAYDTLVSTEGNTISLRDAQSLGKANGYIPVEWVEALLQLEGYVPVLATLVGVDHALVRNYLDGLTRLKRMQLSLRYALVDECGDSLAPAIIVYYFQLRVRCWMEEQWESNHRIEPPSFTQELRIFKMSKNLSWLPGVADVPALRKLRKGGDSPAGKAPASRTAGGKTRQSPKGGSPLPASTQTRVENPTPDPRFKTAPEELRSRISSWKIAKAMSIMKEKGKGPCLRGDGKEMCHSWHAKGFCYSSCKLSYDHAEPSEEERNRFWDWCQEAYSQGGEIVPQGPLQHPPETRGSLETDRVARSGRTAVAARSSRRLPVASPGRPESRPRTSPSRGGNKGGNRPRTPQKAYIYPPDRLDRHVAKAVAIYEQSNSWGDFVRAVRGRGDLHPDVRSLPHPAARLLQQFQHEGTPAVMSTPPWGAGRLAAALARGPHKSSLNGIEFLREEYADMMDKQQWTVLPAAKVMGLQELRLSPLGLVPQRGRRDRMISDYSYFGVNAETQQVAPKEAMQFGRTLHRLLQRIHRANERFGPVYLSKIDLSDGFYRLWVKPEDTIRLAVLFPARVGEAPLVGIPLTNPMGWCSSPPNFSACTETIADLANGVLQRKGGLRDMRQRPHRLDAVAESPVEAELKAAHRGAPQGPLRGATAPLKTPLRYWDIYVDDFCGLVQGNRWTRRAVKRALLHSLDRVFRPLDTRDIPYRQEPASLKKLCKGDATWSTSKIILGWWINTVDRTIRLPPHRVDRLNTILASVPPGQKYSSTKDWHKLLGELRSMSIAIPGSAGLFSLLQEALRHQEKGRNRLRLTSALHGFLEDFRWLARDVASRPTRIAELIPDTWPATIGACDAAGAGMGGVHYIPLADGTIQPILWRKPFPDWVRRELVSFSNPAGSITNSDLELVGSIAHNDILAQAAEVAERTTLNLYDNTATVHWQRKGSTTTTGPAAYLLRVQALHQRYYRYVPLRDYIPGPANVMADMLSRAWHLTDRAALDCMPVAEAHVFYTDLLTLQETMRASVTTGYARKKDAHWASWLEFCLSQQLDPFLRATQDPVPYLQVFGARYQDGRISPSRKRARAHTVSDAIRSVGQAFTRLGSPDPRFNRFGELDARLAAQYRAYRNAEPPSSRVKPVPITIIVRALNFAYRERPTAERQAIANMMCIAFLFCLRPGEYTGTTTDDQAFALEDVALFIGSRRLNTLAASHHEINSATSLQLTFTTQKNGIKGDIIAHSRSGDPLCCPVTAVIRQILLHREQAAPAQPNSKTKLASYYNHNKVNVRVTAAMITTTMRWHAATLKHTTGISPQSLSARSLRAGGAMALLQGRCDSNVIKLLARWHSDAMMRYLHQQSVPLFRPLAPLMFNNGTYSFLPEESVPCAARPARPSQPRPR